jgi:hypothetical protein
MAQVGHKQSRLVFVVQHKHVGVRVVRGRGSHHGILRAYEATQLHTQLATAGRVVGRALGAGGLGGAMQAGGQGLYFGIEAV